MEMTIRKAIQWLEMYANKPVKWDDYSDESRDVREEAEKQIAEAFRMAVDALKAQEPVKPTWKNGYPLCGECGFKLHWILEQNNYCPDCGRAVKWE